MKQGYAVCHAFFAINFSLKPYMHCRDSRRRHLAGRFVALLDRLLLMIVVHSFPVHEPSLGLGCVRLKPGSMSLLPLIRRELDEGCIDW